MITLDLSILNQKGTPMFYSDLTANRPSAGIVGRIFIATDSPYGLFRDTGSAWEQIAGSGGGGGNTIYTANDTLTSNRIVSSGGFDLSFTSTTYIGTATIGGGGSGKLIVGSSSADNGIQVFGANAPSIRVDNLQSGGTQRLVIGLSTATNNFIQGSTSGDICISTASANPILFGMWQTINATEVMRISTSSNLLIGYIVDSGYKVNVNGTGRFSGNLTIGSSPSFQNITLDTTSATQNIQFYKLGAYNSYLWISSGLNHSSSPGGGTYLPFTGSSFNGTSCSLSEGMVNLTSGSLSNIVRFFGTGVTQQGVIGFASGSTTMQFRTNGATSITTGSLGIAIFGNTNVAIGTSTDSGFKLDIQGSTRINGSFRIDGQSSATAGGSAGLHLIINLDGTNYKIALLNV